MFIQALVLSLALIQNACCQQKNEIPNEITQAELDALDKKLQAYLGVINAWKNAGADLQTRPIVLFEIRHWKKGIFDSLPNPDFPFGIALTDSDITDDGLKDLSRFSNLETLNLSWTRITGKGLFYLKNLKGLTNLDLEGTDLTDAGLMTLAGLESIEILNLRQTNITNNGIPHLARLKKLHRLNVKVTSVSADGLKSLPRYVDSSPSVGNISKEFTNSIGMRLKLIPKGTFIMGSPVENAGPDKLYPFGFEPSEGEQPHEVKVSWNYFLGVTEVTQGQFEKVMGENPSWFLKQNNPKFDTSKYPVENLSWNDAVEFCKRLSELPEEKKARRNYRLPTEAEWEYACRSGSKKAFSFGASVESLGDYAWFNMNSRRQPHPVGEKKPNDWGLYDMHGNVNEWCADTFWPYQKETITDPICLVKSGVRIFRGGYWNTDDIQCRSAFRSGYTESDRLFGCGIRVALNTLEINK